MTEPDVLSGLGFGIGVFAAFGWGYHHWGADWHEHHVVNDHHTYFTRRWAVAGHDNFVVARTTFAQVGGVHGDA